MTISRFCTVHCLLLKSKSNWLSHNQLLEIMMTVVPNHFLVNTYVFEKTPNLRYRWFINFFSRFIFKFRSTECMFLGKHLFIISVHKFSFSRQYICSCCNQWYPVSNKNPVNFLHQSEKKFKLSVIVSVYVSIWLCKSLSLHQIQFQKPQWVSFLIMTTLVS